MENYFELIIDINPEISDVVSDICFTNFDCEGVVLAEEAWKDLEMVSTTEGELKAFLTSKPDNATVARILTENRNLLLERGFSEEELGSWAFAITEKERLRLKCRLYQLEEVLPEYFVKINQSCVANIRKVARFDTSVSGTLLIKFKNGYKDYVSRRQMKAVKERLGL